MFRHLCWHIFWHFSRHALTPSLTCNLAKNTYNSTYSDMNCHISSDIMWWHFFMLFLKHLFSHMFSHLFWEISCILTLYIYFIFIYLYSHMVTASERERRTRLICHFLVWYIFRYFQTFLLASILGHKVQQLGHRGPRLTWTPVSHPDPKRRGKRRRCWQKILPSPGTGKRRSNDSNDSFRKGLPSTSASLHVGDQPVPGLV